MAKKNNHVYKVIRTGKNTTLISVGRVIPKSWKYVIIEVVKREENEITLKLKKVELPQ